MSDDDDRYSPYDDIKPSYSSDSEDESIPPKNNVYPVALIRKKSRGKRKPQQFSSKDDSTSPVVSSEDESTRNRMSRGKRKPQPLSNNKAELSKKLLYYALILLLSLFEIALVNPLFRNTQLLFLGEVRGAKMNDIPNITDEHKEAINKQQTVYKDMINDFNAAQEHVGNLIDPEILIEVLSETLPDLYEENIGNMVFNDYLKDGEFKDEHLPDSRADTLKNYIKQITATIEPVGIARGRLTGLNLNTTSSITADIGKTQLMAPFVGNFIFTGTEFPTENGQKLFDQLKTLTNETIGLMTSIYTSMIHVYQTHMYFYAGALGHVLQAVLRLQDGPNPLEINLLADEVKELIPDKKNLSDLFKTTTKTDEPPAPVRLEEAVITLKKISETAVVPYKGSSGINVNNDKDVIHNDGDIINNMLKTLQETHDKFIKSSDEKDKINDDVKQLKLKMKNISNTLDELIKLFETKHTEEGKLVSNVDNLLKLRPLISIESEGHITVDLFFSEFYQFLFQQMVFILSMTYFLKTIGNKNEYNYPIPVTTELVFRPFLSKFLGLEKRETRRGNKKKTKATKRKSGKGKKKVTKKKKKKKNKKRS
jgi:hypothetical protein